MILQQSGGPNPLLNALLPPFGVKGVAQSTFMGHFKHSIITSPRAVNVLRNRNVWKRMEFPIASAPGFSIGRSEDVL
jgi:hypothetical protein